MPKFDLDWLLIVLATDCGNYNMNYSIGVFNYKKKKLTTSVNYCMYELLIN